MSIYTSGTQARDGRTVNHDPNPWVIEQEGAPLGHYRFPTHAAACAEFNRADGDRIIRRMPHPEYAVLDNPILAGFRANSFSTRWHAEYWIKALDAHNAFGAQSVWSDPQHAFHSLSNATPEQIEHARRVLTKLAALS